MDIQKTNQEPSSQAKTNMSIEKILAAIIFAQYGIMVLLLTALSSEYQSSATYKAWIDSNIAPVGFLLNYYVAPLLGVFVAVLTVIFWDRFAQTARLK
jgi:hypothetical protein